MEKFQKAVKILRKNRFALKYGSKFKTGKKVTIGKRSDILIMKNGMIKMENRVSISENSHIAAISGQLTIGKNTWFNRNANVVCREKISIGDNCSIGPGVTMYDHDHKIGKNGLEPGYNTKEIIIEEHCWIGANVTILRGTHIGKNCVIGAGCVVKGNIPDNTLVVPETKNRFIDLNEKYGSHGE